MTTSTSWLLTSSRADSLLKNKTYKANWDLDDVNMKQRFFVFNLHSVKDDVAKLMQMWQN